MRRFFCQKVWMGVGMGWWGHHPWGRGWPWCLGTGFGGGSGVRGWLDPVILEGLMALRLPGAGRS